MESWIGMVGTTMKPKAILAIVVCTAAAAFLIGKMNSAPDASGSKEAGAEENAASQRRSRATVDADAGAGKERNRPGRPAAGGKDESTVLDAAKLTREQRLELLGKGAISFNNGDQVGNMLAVIGALQAGEMRDAASLIGRAQRNGNFQDPQVWTALWYQWGKVDPLDCFARFREIPEGKGPGDVRNTMRGWLEKDPAAAAAWSKEADRTPLEASAAAMALAHAAGGDPMKLQASLESMPEGAARKLGVKEIFDMELMKDNGRNAAQIYDSLPQSLKADGWGATAQRLAMTEPASAKEWITRHAGESGTNYGAARGLIMDLANGEPAAATKWAVDLPGLPEVAGELPASGVHPVAMTGARWLQADPDGFKTWLATQAQDQVWVKQFQGVIARTEASRGQTAPR